LEQQLLLEGAMSKVTLTLLYKPSCATVAQLLTHPVADYSCLQPDLQEQHPEI